MIYMGMLDILKWMVGYTSNEKLKVTVDKKWLYTHILAI